MSYQLSKYVMFDTTFNDQDSQQPILAFSSRTSNILHIGPSLYNQITNREWLKIQEDKLDELLAKKIIVKSSENELRSIIEENKEAINGIKTLKLVLQPTAACPLGCHYCGQQHSAKKLNRTKHVVEFSEHMLSKQSFQNIHVTWFGSEPLSGLSNLIELSSSLMSLASEKNIEYSASIVTNGLLLSKKVADALVKQHKILSFEITLDGDAESHDKRRMTKTGSPTFQRIYSNLRNFANDENLKSAELTVRANVDESNRDRIEPLIRLLAKDGLQNRIQFYVAPIHSWGHDEHKLAASKQDFAQWEIEWFLLMLQLGFQPALIPKRKPIVCTAVSKSSFLIDPEGSVFGCTEVSLVDSYGKGDANKHRFGDLTDSSVDASPKRHLLGNFNDEVLEGKHGCSYCPMLPVCGGHCPKEWKEGIVPCPSFKFNMQDRMLLSYLVSKNQISAQETESIPQ